MSTEVTQNTLQLFHHEKKPLQHYLHSPLSYLKDRNCPCDKFDKGKCRTSVTFISRS